MFPGNKTLFSCPLFRIYILSFSMQEKDKFFAFFFLFILYATLVTPFLQFAHFVPRPPLSLFSFHFLLHGYIRSPHSFHLDIKNSAHLV